MIKSGADANLCRFLLSYCWVKLDRPMRHQAQHGPHRIECLGIWGRGLRPKRKSGDDQKYDHRHQSLKY
ncbi:hypothetical protein FHS72_003671 [Loktanella ponticola]|uniref:Uncharacterized protein n=1 Tax=Yoonia ponticola TaxID=1524255 RepID=A0A7W9BP68_9RHOB|nr:hypothetical protein [Yoonia ponticola]